MLRWFLAAIRVLLSTLYGSMQLLGVRSCSTLLVVRITLIKVSGIHIFVHCTL